MGTGAAALCAAMLFALAPVTVLAEGSQRSHTRTESTQRFADSVNTATAPTKACLAARQAIKDARLADKAEDLAERKAIKAGKLTKKAAKDADVTEKAHMKSLRDTAKTECAGQLRTPPTAECTAAKLALKVAKAHKDPAATLKRLKDAKRAACAK